MKILIGALLPILAIVANITLAHDIEVKVKNIYLTQCYWSVAQDRAGYAVSVSVNDEGVYQATLDMIDTGELETFPVTKIKRTDEEDCWYGH